jgi:AcrR family transcriptional regulator
LTAGAALLKEQGVAALTQPKVAKAAGVKQSHLTYYFPKRTDLLFGIAEHSIANVMADLSSRLEEESSHAALAETVTAAMIAGGPPRVMLGLIVAADADAAIRLPLCELIGQSRAHMQSVLEKAGIASNADAALLFHATVVGLALLHEARRTPESAREVRDGVAGMLRLLSPATPKRKRKSA